MITRLLVVSFFGLLSCTVGEDGEDGEEAEPEAEAEPQSNV